GNPQGVVAQRVQPRRCRRRPPSGREAFLRRHGRYSAGEIEAVAVVHRERSRALVSASAVAFAARRRAAEFVIFWEALWRNTAGLGTGTPPILELFHFQCETATGAVDPGHSVICLESRDVGKP